MGGKGKEKQKEKEKKKHLSQQKVLKLYPLLNAHLCCG